MMVLPLVMKKEKNFKEEKMLKLTHFCNFKRALGKICVLKIAGETIDAGDFLEIFSFLGLIFLQTFFL